MSALVYNREKIVVAENYPKTIRRCDFWLICPHRSSSLQHCPSCRKYCSQLFVDKSREITMTVNWTNHYSHIRSWCLNPSEKDEPMRNLVKVKWTEKCKKTRLREQLQKGIEDKGVSLTEDCDDITALLLDVFPLTEKRFSDGFTQRILCEQHTRYSSLSVKQQMWRHPLLIRLALNLKYASTLAYHPVQESGLISFPSKRTLRTILTGCQSMMAHKWKFFSTLRR